MIISHCADQRLAESVVTSCEIIHIHGEPTNGLGMSIIKTIVEWHKGKIWFESTEEKGSTFYVEVPKDL